MTIKKNKHAICLDDGSEESASSKFLEKVSRKSVARGANGKEKDLPVGHFEIFRYADRWDKLSVLLGTVCALVHGTSLPLLIIFFGQTVGYISDFGKLEFFLNLIPDFLEANNLTRTSFIRDPRTLDKSLCDQISDFYGGNVTCIVSLDENIYDVVSRVAIKFFIPAGISLVFGYGQFVFWIISSEKQANRIRRACLLNILHQNIGWFDVHNAAELNSRLTDDIVKIQDGIGDKLGNCIFMLGTAISSFAIAFAHGWKLAAVTLALSPAFMLVAAAIHKIVSSVTSFELKEYAKAGAIAQEVFAAIKTVVAFGAQEKEALRYCKNLDNARGFGIRNSIFLGISMGVFHLVWFCSQGLGFWYGGKLHRKEPDSYSVDTILTVFFSIVTGCFATGNSFPGLQTLSVARGAASVVFKLIELKSPINSASYDGIQPNDSKGVIEFKDVHFTYPSRPDMKVLNGVNLEVLPGQTMVLVGGSGSGKSTTVQLLLRFYDPDQGQILLDGRDIREINVRWLRKHIGLVSQEPVLFATTIAENIRYGREDVTMDEIIAAATDANAYDFIMQLPDKFETFVGERGAQLSGGQKQRIAIARALVRDPKILLLDEATSSLDNESESIVQDALDKACRGRTTIIVTHRLSTIKNADKIVGIQSGQVMEKGTHDELMDQKGIYYQLVMNQMTSENKDDEENIEENLNSNDFSCKELNLSTGLKEEEKQDDNDEELPSAPFSRLLKMNAPEWYFIALGCLGSVINGCTYPLFGILLSRAMNIFSKDLETQKEELKEQAFLFIGLGCFTFLTNVLQAAMFGFSGEALTMRLRDLGFRAALKQDIAWYDEARNGVGALTTRLSTDASQVQGVTGVRLGAMLNSLTTIVASIIIAAIYGWKMTLVLVAFLPFIALSDFIKHRMGAGQSGKTKAAFEGAGKVTVESIGNIRTVASLSKEQTFFSLYMAKLDAPYKAVVRNAHFAGITFSFSQSVTFLFHATAFVFGAAMIEDGEMTTEEVLRVFLAIVLGGMGIASASMMVPDLGKAQTSAKRIIQLLDSVPSIDYSNSGGKKLTNDYAASLTFNDVKFHYPTRQTVTVLKGLDLSVSAGQTIALVGRSGCGKSTTVQLIERFYDTVAGCVCLDQNDIKTLNIEWLRSQMAIVSQEPVLFDLTIAENIAYGENSRDIMKEEIIAAARTANIHNFITSLPSGYETNVGSGGTQLSGGQKQRIAIARALLRNPKILLLDEATSSLDTESEKVVQEALNKAREGRTCIVIAHRLSTVQNADKIYVISHGGVSEQGTHNELMAMKGFYHKLVEKSMRKV